MIEQALYLVESLATFLIEAFVFAPDNLVANYVFELGHHDIQDGALRIFVISRLQNLFFFYVRIQQCYLYRAPVERSESKERSF